MHTQNAHWRDGWYHANLLVQPKLIESARLDEVGEVNHSPYDERNDPDGDRQQSTNKSKGQADGYGRDQRNLMSGDCC